MEQTYSSPYKGVSPSDSKVNPWRARIHESGRERHLGVFKTPEEAAAAIRADRAARPLGKKSPRWLSAVRVYDDDRTWFEIELTQNKWAKVDLADMDLVIHHCWYLNVGYAASWEGRRIFMHRHILGLSDDDQRQPDHKNHDPLDNRRSNLRDATHARNGANISREVGISGFRGVSPSNRRWKANICISGKNIYLGTFDTPEQAALAYNRAALEAWGEFAILNQVST